MIEQVTAFSLLLVSRQLTSGRWIENTLRMDAFLLYGFNFTDLSFVQETIVVKTIESCVFGSIVDFFLDHPPSN